MPAKVTVSVFLGWSGPRSKAVAQALANWLPQVIQAVTPWLSESMDRGAQWFATIGVHLKGADYGLLCVTPENATEPWVLFEAGALAIHTSERLTCPYLLDMTPAQLGQPLGQLQAAAADKDGTWQVVQTMNRVLDEPVRLPEDRLRRAFDQWWPELEGQLGAARKIAAAQPTAPERSDADKLDEILETVRALQRAEARGIDVTGTRIIDSRASLPLTAGPIHVIGGAGDIRGLSALGGFPAGSFTDPEIKTYLGGRGLLAYAPPPIDAPAPPPPPAASVKGARPVRRLRAKIKKISKPPPKG